MPESPEALQEQVRKRLQFRLMTLLESKAQAQEIRRRRAEIDEDLRQLIAYFCRETRCTPFSEDVQKRLIEEAIDSLVGLGPLDEPFRDPGISEIMVNGPHQIFIERDGHIEELAQVFDDNQHLLRVIERMLEPIGRTVNESDPICDASLPDGSRVNVIIPPLVLNGPVITIRRKSRDWTMQEFLNQNVLTKEMAEFFQGCIAAKVNMVISGGTSTGKTTMVAILSSFIPQKERLITIENVPELELPNRKHWIRMVGKLPNIQGKGEIPLRALVTNALRMRPDRIILGESRGGEALDVVQAMHSGHDGFMTVLHANSAEGALERLETLMLMSDVNIPVTACRKQIGSAVDLVIHMARFADGTRRVATVAQVLGNTAESYQLEDLFRLDAESFSADGQMQASQRYTGIRPRCLSKFQLNNIPIPAWIK